jgi:hypothetical protein
MPRSPQAGTFVLSIDLSSAQGAPETGSLSVRALEDICDALAAAELPATWAVPSRAAPECDAFRRACGRGELAVLAIGPSGEGFDRAALAAQLAAGLRQAQNVGHRPTTLVVPGSTGLDRDLPEQDLLVKHGITAIRVDAPTSRATWWRRRSAGMSQMRSVRWGLTEVSHAVRLRERGLSATLRALDRAAAGEFVVVVADAEQLSSGSRDLMRLIGRAGQLAGEHAVHCRTIAGAVAERAIHRRTGAARSILRPAA